MNEELPGQISSLTWKKCLCSVRILSWKEIRQLRLKQRILPEVHEDPLTWLHKNCVQRKWKKKKLPSKCRKMKAKATYQYCNFYKKMAEGLGKELKGNTSYHEKEICVSEKGLKTGGCWGKNWEQADADQDWVQVPAYRSTYSQQRPRNIRGSPVSSISPESKKVMLWMLKDLGSLSSLTQNSVPGHP